jgi:hypothetical protein
VKRCKLLGAILGVSATLFAPASAQGAVDSVTAFGIGSPTGQNATTPTPATIEINVEMAYSGSAGGEGACGGPQPDDDCAFSPQAREILVTLDEDFVIDPGALPQCPASSILTATTATARANCPGSILGDGTGTIRVDDEDVATVYTAFNAVPSGSDPKILFHARTAAPLNTTTLFTGTVTAPNVIDIDVPAIPSFAAFNDFQSTLEPVPVGAGTAVSARCSDGDWFHLADVTFETSFTLTGGETQGCTPQSSLAVSIVGPGTGAVTGPGVSCPPDCTHAVGLSGTYDLAANPTGGSTFQGWGADCTFAGLVSSCALSGATNRVVSAVFQAPPVKKNKKKCKRKKPGKGKAAGPGKKCKKKRK